MSNDPSNDCYIKITTYKSFFVFSELDIIKKSESTLNTPRGQYLRSTLLAIPSTSQDLVVSTLSNVHIQKNNNGIFIVLVSSTEMDVHSEFSAFEVHILSFDHNRCSPGAVCIIKWIRFYSEKKSFAFGGNRAYYRKSLWRNRTHDDNKFRFSVI